MLLYTPGEWWRYVLLLNGTLTGLALEVVVKDSAPAFFKVCSKGLTWWPQARANLETLEQIKEGGALFFY